MNFPPPQTQPPPHSASGHVTVSSGTRPSVGRDGGKYSSDLGFGKSEYFCKGGLDMKFTDLPVGQISDMAGPTANPVLLISSSTANLPAASGSRSPRALRARSQERVDGSYRLASCRPLRDRGRPCAT